MASIWSNTERNQNEMFLGSAFAMQLPAMPCQQYGVTAIIGSVQIKSSVPFSIAWFHGSTDFLDLSCLSAFMPALRFAAFHLCLLHCICIRCTYKTLTIQTHSAFDYFNIKNDTLITVLNPVLLNTEHIWKTSSKDLANFSSPSTNQQLSWQELVKISDWVSNISWQESAHGFILKFTYSCLAYCQAQTAKHHDVQDSEDWKCFNWTKLCCAKQGHCSISSGLASIWVQCGGSHPTDPRKSESSTTDCQANWQDCIKMPDEWKQGFWMQGIPGILRQRDVEKLLGMAFSPGIINFHWIIQWNKFPKSALCISQWCLNCFSFESCWSPTYCKACQN